MAKAKKSESKETDAPKKPAGRKAPAKKSSAPTGQPLVDTSLAAQNAAKHLAAGLPHKAAASGGGSGGAGASGAKTESSMFKNLKQGLAKPHLAGLDNLLDKSAPAETKRSNLPFGGGKQVGHNQTFGADVNRAGVPRRTPG